MYPSFWDYGEPPGDVPPKTKEEIEEERNQKALRRNRIVTNILVTIMGASVFVTALAILLNH